MCVCVLGSLPSSHLIADKELETEKKQREPKLKRGRVYYKQIKDRTRLSLPLSLSLCVGGWGVGGLRVGWGWVVLPFPAECWGLSFWGEQDGISLLVEGRVWGLISGNHIDECLVNSKPVEAFEMSFTNPSPPPKRVLKMKQGKSTAVAKYYEHRTIFSTEGSFG